MTDETIIVGQTLDLTYYVTEDEDNVSNASEVNFNNGPSEEDILNYKESLLWTPKETGEYIIEVGTQEISIKVTDTPDSLILNRKIYYSFNDGTATNQENPGVDDGNPTAGITYPTGGVNQNYADVPTADYFQPNTNDDFVNTYSTNTGAFTYLFWIYTDEDGEIYNARGNRIRIDVNTDGIRFSMYDSAHTYTTYASIPNNTWTMITARYDDTKSPDMRITANNDFANEGTADFNSSIEQDIREEYIMTGYSGADIGGRLDEFMFYDSWKTDSDIQEIYDYYQ